MPLVIPIFIPHEGCPHCCIFCNQQSISGHSTEPVRPREIDETIRIWLDRCQPKNRGQVQVAFYGGSFSGLPAKRQDELLGAVRPFLEQGRVQEIRLSTRPDYIDNERLALLIRHRVGIIELGAQSCDDRVLQQAGRGHSSAAIAKAARLIKASGIRLGLQLMLGLPGDRFQTLRRTVQEVIRLQPDFVRLYPVLVLKGSGLESLYHQGGYRPLSLGKAVALTAYMKKRFDDQGIQVVRMGLHPTDELEQALVAGPYHPAFGELVKSRIFFNEVRRQLCRYRGRSCRLILAEQDRSLFSGQKKCSVSRLQHLHLLEHATVMFTDSPGQRGIIRVE